MSNADMDKTAYLKKGWGWYGKIEWRFLIWNNGFASIFFAWS
jgi:hypothetical protein